MDPVRIIYHAAPGPAADGSIVKVPPIDLGTDNDFALAWIRRRLGLTGLPDEVSLRFKAEIVPLPEPIDPEEALAALAAGPTKKVGQAAAAPKPAQKSRFGRGDKQAKDGAVPAMETVASDPFEAAPMPDQDLPSGAFGPDDK